MSPIRLTIALSISIVLIGGALWFRLVRIPPYSVEPASVQAIETLPSEESISSDLFNAEASLPETSTPLSQTDKISRQLLSDYLGLKSQGQITPSQINTLAENYAQNIGKTDITIAKVNPKQIIVLPNSEANLTTYGNAMASMYDKYTKLATIQVQNSKGGIANIGSPSFSTLASALSKLYQASANEMLLVRVPATLATNHENLINYYLESAEVMKLLGNISKEPMQAYAALNIYMQSTGRESELLLNIKKTMLANGIILESNI